MSVVEERVSAPPKTGEDAREERARTLEAAALEIEVRGWTQGDYCDDGGAVCMAGALKAAHGLKPHQSISSREWCAWGYDDINRHNVHAPTWNDAPERTVAEVLFVLRWRAAEVRDGR